MFTVWGSKRATCCDGVSRREFLRLGALGLGGLTLADLAPARGEGKAASSSMTSVIMIYLYGGMSHLDMYDMKPEAPAEYRGEFKPIQTNVPGFHICEHMPKQATIADKLAVIRNWETPPNPGHGAPALMTGAVDNFNKYPAFGSIVSRLRGAIRDGMPQYVATGLGGETPTAYLGKAHEPFVPDAYANSELRKSLKLATTPERFTDRQALLQSFDTLRRDLDRTLPGMDGMTASALEMISSGKVRDALDVTKEPEAVRAKYGKATLWLRARRLVEAGVSFVTLRGEGDWDTHEHNFPRLRKLMPELDQAVHALVTDLHERGLDKDVAVVVWSEMGRTPKIGTQQGLVGGRDHFATGSVLMAGGGFTRGQTIGSTGPRGEKSTSIPYRATHVLATLYTHLGIDPATTLPGLNGRPMYLLDDRRTIAELV